MILCRCIKCVITSVNVDLPFHGVLCNKKRLKYFLLAFIPITEVNNLQSMLKPKTTLLWRCLSLVLWNANMLKTNSTLNNIETYTPKHVHICTMGNSQTVQHWILICPYVDMLGGFIVEMFMDYYMLVVYLFCLVYY